jgi:hypothetical protein
MGMVENQVSSELAERVLCWSDDWLLISSRALLIETRRRTNPMKYVRMLGLAAVAAVALCAFAASACASVLTGTSRKTRFTEFHEFDDLTIKGNTMTHTYTLSSGNTCGKPINQHNTSAPNCYIGGLSLDTAQLTVQSATTNEVQSNIDSREFVNSTSGTYEGTHQLKARLA